MKTSDKLLISVGILFFIIPLMGMIIVSKVYFKTAKTQDNVTYEFFNDKSFAKPSKGRTAIPINRPFHAIHIINGNKSCMELHLNQSNDYGVKIPKGSKEEISFKVKNNVLNIILRKGFRTPSYENRMLITVYSPKFDALSIKNTSDFNLIATSDSLNISLANCKSFTVQNPNVEAHTLKSKGGLMNYKTVNTMLIKNLNVDLDNSEFSLSDQSVDNLSFKAQNNSTINLDGTNENKGKFVAGKLKIKTLGVNVIKIDNFTAKEIKADFSEETTLEIPSSILKLLVKSN
ncbi:GIN domain-containing protein [Arcticibacter eurypsychrophilus]|uniref:GIN domain-containing protein n=1 Tax=Arcticibacter eurypsychrophilus TaxID=1434752 RepID=UPI00084DD864|nr:DUF2807 domain-containing protein [Arcticibacter eurypsychrophilus]